MSDRNPFRCQYISERHGIQCSLPRHHVDSMDPEKQAHRAWDDNGIPTLKVDSTDADRERIK